MKEPKKIIISSDEDFHSDVNKVSERQYYSKPELVEMGSMVIKTQGGGLLLGDTLVGGSVVG